MTDLWPLVLFALRLGAVALLYLFLLSAFRALRADLRGVAVTEAPAAAVPLAESPPDAIADAEPADERPVWRPARPVEAPLTSGRTRSRGLVAAALLSPAVIAVLLVMGGVLSLTGGSAQQPIPASSDAARASGGNESTPFGPPAVPPAPGRVTVGLAAVQPAQVRVTVDGVVQFEGILAAGQRQAWEGGQRIQVWTDSGRTLLLAVNGEQLGPYSPAMGHPDWNRIDFGFWPGWGR